LVTIGECFAEVVGQFGGVVEVRICELYDGQALDGRRFAGRAGGQVYTVQLCAREVCAP
jgi:hypothetical protein